MTETFFASIEARPRNPVRPGTGIICHGCRHRRGRGCRVKETARPWVVVVCPNTPITYSECNENGGRLPGER